MPFIYHIYIFQISHKIYGQVGSSSAGKECQPYITIQPTSSNNIQRCYFFYQNKYVELKAKVTFCLMERSQPKSVRVGEGSACSLSPGSPYTPSPRTPGRWDPGKNSQAIFWKAVVGSFKQVLPLADQSGRCVTLPTLHFWSEGKKLGKIVLHIISLCNKTTLLWGWKCGGQVEKSYNMQYDCFAATRTVPVFWCIAD